MKGSNDVAHDPTHRLPGLWEVARSGGDDPGRLVPKGVRVLRGGSAGEGGGVNKAEYHTYLASRDWAIIKRQVKARSGGTCAPSVWAIATDSPIEAIIARLNESTKHLPKGGDRYLIAPYDERLLQASWLPTSFHNWFFGICLESGR